MSSSIDEWIGTEVERSFAGEPPLRDPREYAAKGRRARRRRRATVGTLGVASVAIVAALLANIAGTGAAPHGNVEPAGSTDVVPVRVTAPIPVDPAQTSECAASSLGPCGPQINYDDLRLDDANNLIRGYPDVDVTGHYEQVLAGYPISAAFEIERGGHTAWALLTNRGDTSSTDLRFAPPDPSRTFDEWVHDSVESGRWFSYPEALPQ